MTSPTFRCGFVAVVGRPNVGKSTLINRIMGRKISIVTAKPQTTRHRILAVHSRRNAQIVFVDTPGLHRRAGKAMNRLMNRAAISALSDADLVLFVSEATRWTDEDADVLKRIEHVRTPAMALLNKVDKVHPKERLLEAIAEIADRYEFAEVLPISAHKGSNIDRLVELIPRFLPQSPPLFPPEMHTDRSAEFHAAELIREKLTVLLRQEIPYGLTVQIERYEREGNGMTIHAIVWVERDSQKGIVVGRQGSVLKKVGKAARQELIDELDCPVHLELWVKVRENWADKEEDLLRLGYESP